MGAAQIGKGAFIGPQQRRITTNELLDSLEADYRLSGKNSAQVKSQLKAIRAHFGAWRAVNVDSDTIDAFIESRLVLVKC